MSALIDVRDLTYSYPGATAPALSGVSVRIEPGEFCVVAGLSASGKSTLVRAACGLVPHFHGGDFRGSVIVAGLDTREHGPATIGAVAGVVFQDPETQVVMGTPRAEIALGLENLARSATAIARGVEEVAVALGIAALLDRPTHELSGGELQRVALAAALAPRPRIVLLDEPTSQLDPVSGDELIWLLRRLNQEWDTAVVLIEHRLERCLAAADRVIVLDGGRIVSDCDPQAFSLWAREHAPALETPAARLFARASIEPLPVGVRQARGTLRALGLLPAPGSVDRGSPLPVQAQRGSGRLASGIGRLARRRGDGPEAALAVRGLWCEIADGPSILRGIDVEIQAGERVVLMGRNGAGKSTLLRHLSGLEQPTRGTIVASGSVGLLLQNPNDYFLHERVGDEASHEALVAVGLESVAQSNPHDLSGGQRQRLALAIVSDWSQPPAVLALDEPTRGMDRAAKDELRAWLSARREQGTAIIVATHDVEFAAELADRILLMADGRVIADGPAAEILCGGWYFTTDTARVLDGAGDALTPDQGAAILSARMAGQVAGEPGCPGAVDSPASRPADRSRAGVAAAVRDLRTEARR